MKSKLLLFIFSCGILFSQIEITNAQVVTEYTNDNPVRILISASTILEEWLKELDKEVFEKYGIKKLQFISLVIPEQGIRQEPSTTIPDWKLASGHYTSPMFDFDTSAPLPRLVVLRPYFEAFGRISPDLDRYYRPQIAKKIIETTAYFLLSDKERTEEFVKEIFQKLVDQKKVTEEEWNRKLFVYTIHKKFKCVTSGSSAKGFIGTDCSRQENAKKNGMREAKEYCINSGNLHCGNVAFIDDIKDGRGYWGWGDYYYQDWIKSVTYLGSNLPLDAIEAELLKKYKLDNP